MTTLKTCRFVLLSVLAASLRATLAADPVAAAGKALVARIVPAEAAGFEVESIPRRAGADVFEVESVGGKVVLRGSDGVSIAGALNWYLENCAHCSVSWCGDNLTLPKPMPSVSQRVRRVTPFAKRYYLNYCTFSYTMAWWDWDRWQREIDWMALKGINMPLALTGQNAVLRRVYKTLGFSDDELASFFSGPAYFAWFWMGNLDGWGGPLPVDFLDRQEALQRRILERERSLGMTPVLPAFSGHVPATFSKHFPSAKVRLTNWNSGFGDVALIDPSDPAFVEVGRSVLAEEIRSFGTDHLYSADTFNENRPPTGDTGFLTSVSARVYESMAGVDPEAVWVMQGWLFHHDRDYWKPERVKALLDGVPDDRMVVLDLFSDAAPMWDKTEAFHGKPWIWCMLHNFGGRSNLFGRLDAIAQGPAAVRADPKAGRLVGIGLTPEAIGQNPVAYDLMMANVWSEGPIDVNAWLSGYVVRRYGADDAHAANAWRILARTAYGGHTERGAESIITARPTLEKSANFVNTELGYAQGDLVAGWEELMAASAHLGSSDGFRYDLVDVTRQVLANYADIVQQRVAEAYRRGDRDQVRAEGARFLALVDDIDALVGTRREFLLGRWLAAARACGANGAEADLFERNARDQLTLWGGPESPLHDYASKHWSGLLSSFYKQRWERYFSALEEALTAHAPFVQTEFDARLRVWEWDWVGRRDRFPETPAGDELEMARRLHAHYAAVLARELPKTVDVP